MPKIMRPMYKNSVLKNFAKFTSKHLCRSLLFNELAGLQSCAKPLKTFLRFSRFPSLQVKRKYIIITRQ